MSSLPRIDYYFDVVSPFAYIGFEALHQIEKQWSGVTVKYIPFFVAAVMKESGNSTPASVPAKTRMFVADAIRMGKYWDVPIRTNPKFIEWLLTYNTRRALRILLVLQAEDEELMKKAAREMWLRLWYRREKIFENADFEEILKAVGVNNIQEVIDKSESPEIKNKLAENTKTAVDQGAFGTPWIAVHTTDGNTTNFFGGDRFHLIAELLNQPHPLPEKYLAKL
ncbi:unnamed protein product [Caenorhabditis bovis]|uniref:Glutathione S-transferase kappa n=1 Tax=Caenorhabditis bovis TaxID=2654633 RepID=A0A8S1FCD6_9PELO|nr:unnamed protein product [Caenorhabditis bovis]